MGNFQDLLNRFRKGEFNYEQMGNIPEVRQRTNAILNDPRQMFLNTDANYMNMGNSRGVVPNSTITNTESAGAPSQMPMDMGGGIPTHGITGNIGGGIPGTAIGNMGGMATDLQKGIEALKKGKERGGVMNDSTYEALQMLQGY